MEILQEVWDRKDSPESPIRLTRYNADYAVSAPAEYQCQLGTVKISWL